MPGTVDLLTLVAIAAVSFVLLDVIIRRSVVGIGLVFVVTLAHTTFPDLPNQSLGGVTILMWDMVALLLVSAAVARLLRARHITGLQWLLIALGVVLLVSLMQGVFAYGLNTAVVDFRNTFQFVAIALYCSTVEPERFLFDRLGHAFLVLAGCLLLLSVLRWAVLPLGLEGWAKGPSGLRVVASEPTLVMAQGFLIGALAWVRGDASKWMRWLTPALLASVVILQHRTVWAVLLVVVALMLLLEHGAVRKLVPLVVLGLVVITALSMTVLDRGAGELTEELTEQAGQRSTWEWRKEGWHALLTQSGPREPIEFVIGRPFGAGWDRVVGGRLVTVSPHNHYVSMFLRMGLLGLGLLLALYVTILWRLGRGRDPGGLLANRVLFLALVTHLIYFVSYSPSREQGVVLGLAVAAASLAAQARARAESRPAGVKAT